MKKKSDKRVVEFLFINRPVDIKLLKKQRNMLIDELDRWNDNNHGKNDKELYDGLINFLDHILDVAENSDFHRPSKYRFGL